MKIRTMILKNLVVIVIVLMSVNIQDASTNPDAKRLYDDLLSNYNRLIRPVRNHSTNILVKLGLRLSQLIELVSSGINIIQSISLKNFYMFWTELKGSNSYHQRLAWTRKFSTLRKTNNIQGVFVKKNRNGTITNLTGILRNTVEWPNCTSHLNTFGYQTSCFTTSTFINWKL